MLRNEIWLRCSGDSLPWVVLLVFCYIGILLVVALIDWDTQMIYDRFHILILLLGMASLCCFHSMDRSID